LEYTIIAKDLEKTYVVKRGLVRRRIERVKALRGVSFRVRRGEVYGIVGPNGAGKTTTIKILSTLLLPDKGEAHILGYNVVTEAQRVREVIGVSLTVERGFFWKLTGYENLKYFGMLRGLRGKHLEERVNYVLDLVGLKKLGGDKKFFEEYSLGMKARLSIARALLHNPEVIILDEPTLGLDPPSARSIRELLVKLAKESRKTVLITSHNMYEIEQICDRVAVIDKGRIIAEDTVNRLKTMVSREVSVEIEVLKPRVSTSEIAELFSRELSAKVIVNTDEKGLTRIKALVPFGEDAEFIHRAVAVLQRTGAKLRSARIVEPTLEDVFIKLAGRER